MEIDVLKEFDKSLANYFYLYKELNYQRKKPLSDET